MTEEVKRGRPSRAEVLVRERRRRDTGSGAPRKLVVHGQLDDGYEYRWINDRDARLLQKTVEDDWDICKQEGGVVKHDAADGDGAVRSLVGAKKDGSPMYAYLCRKPKELALIDRRKKNTRLDAIENQIKNRAPASSNVDSGEFYTPDSGRNSIKLER